MEKRLFNKLGFETSLLGLGCMRFPQKNGKILIRNGKAGGRLHGGRNQLL